MSSAALGKHLPGVCPGHPSGPRFRGLLLSEKRAQRCGNHALMGFWHPLEQVPSKVHAATLSAAAPQHPADGVGETLIDITDHKFDPTDAALFQ